MSLFTTPRFIPINHTQVRTQDAAITKFRRNLSSTDIATLKTDVETNFPGVGLNFTGPEFDYEVELAGSTAQYEKALTFIFPKGRDDILLEPFETLP